MPDINVVSEQVTTYFSTLHLHPDGLKGGVFTHMSKNNFKNQYAYGYKRSLSNITNMLTDKDKPVFISLNSYKKFPNEKFCKRDNSHLWGIDTVMIDIDADTELHGMEDELMAVLEWGWNSERIPKPNLYSYTGSGGVHLYYCFERLPKSMKDSINALKWAIAETIVQFENDFPTKNGKTYKVDTKIFDSQRLDRVPGSIHEDTGAMCICFKTDTPKYTYKHLVSFFDEHGWKAKYKIENCKKYISKHRGEELESKNKINQKEETVKTVIQQNNNRNKEFDFNALNKKRINAMFKLAKNGKDFSGKREISCFMLRNWCNQLNYTNEKTKKILKNFNCYFSDPLSDDELFRNTRCKIQYKFTNSTIKSKLDLSDEESVLFTKRYRPHDRKEKTLYHKIEIAKLVLEGKTIAEISECLCVSESIVKRRRIEMKKNEGFAYWANYHLTQDEKKTVISSLFNTIDDAYANSIISSKKTTDICEIFKTIFNSESYQTQKVRFAHVLKILLYFVRSSMTLTVEQQQYLASLKPPDNYSSYCSLLT